MALLGTVTGAGRLYDVDVRLRPDGAKGLLVSSLASFADYQRERAWTWEHQALVRARGVAGDAALLRRLRTRARADAGARARCRRRCATDVVAMRQRMRAELDRSDAARFDLKQGEGGLVDLEFLLQYLVLRDAPCASALAGPARHAGPARRGLRSRRCSIAATCDALCAAHAALLDAGLRCTLDRRPRIAAETEAIAAARAAIRGACRRTALDVSQRAAHGALSTTAHASPSRCAHFRGDARGLAQRLDRERRERIVHGACARVPAGVDEPPQRPRVHRRIDTNTGTRVAQASLSMFTESGVQTMRSAHASRPA